MVSPIFTMRSAPRYRWSTSSGIRRLITAGSTPRSLPIPKAGRALGWIRLAAGMGVEAARAETLEEFADLLAASYGRKGPFLIEFVVA
jgi:hypothetical protein